MTTTSDDALDAVRRAALARGAAPEIVDVVTGSLLAEPFLDDGEIRQDVIDDFVTAAFGLPAAVPSTQRGRTARRARHPGTGTSAMDAGTAAYRSRRHGGNSEADDETSTTADSPSDDLGQGRRGSTAGPGTLASGEARYAERHRKADT
jgi:hypothetical protein